MNKMKIMSLKCYSISCRVCHFPSNMHLLPNQSSSSWLPNDISKYSDLEHRKRRFGAIVSSNSGVKTRVLPSSHGLANASWPCKCSCNRHQAGRHISFHSNKCSVALYVHFNQLCGAPNHHREVQ